MRSWVLATCALLATSATATARPPLAPARVDSPSGEYFAALDAVRKRITVYRKRPGGPDQLWSMPGYHNVVFLSDRPDYLVTAHHDGELLRIDQRPDDELIAFYRRGQLVRSLLIHELIRRPDQLKRVGPRRRWCEAMGFVAPDRFRILTSEGQQFLFDPGTGRTVEVATVPIPPGPLILDSP